MGFMLSDEAIPTWWTQSPQESAVLTGWLGGLPAAVRKGTPAEEVLQLSLQSLSRIFKRSIEELKIRSLPSTLSTGLLTLLRAAPTLTIRLPRRKEEKS